MKVSVLIPAYNYAAGIARVLETFNDPAAIFEIIIFDDSSTLDVRRTVDAVPDDSRNIIYQNNIELYGNPMGAPSNWNALMDAARGEYVILMHHDEYPYDSSFYDKVAEAIACNPHADIFLLGLQLTDPNTNPLPIHAPYWIRYLTSTRFPGYLFRRNVIGPTASLIIRRAVAPRFSIHLIWLIDVEFYFNLFSSNHNVIACPNILIGSVQGEHESITKLLSEDIDRIERQEMQHLAKVVPRRTIWLSSIASRFLRAIETIPWLMWRAFSRGHYSITILFGKFWTR